MIGNTDQIKWRIQEAAALMCHDRGQRESSIRSWAR